MARILFIIAFLFSAVLLPWWATVALGIFGLAYFESYVVAITGGLLMDFLFGVSEPRLFGFAYIYAAVFAVLSCIAWYLNHAILE